MTILIPALLLFLQPPPPPATELYQSCKAFTRILDGDRPQSTSSPDYCLGYIRGYFGGAAAFVSEDHICASEASMGTLARVYVAYIDQHPALLDKGPEYGFYGAMMESYPCPAKVARP